MSTDLQSVNASSRKCISRLTVGRLQIGMNHFFPTLFGFGTYASPGAKAQRGSNVVEYVPKKNLGEDEPILEVLVGVLLRCSNIRDGLPMLLIEPEGPVEVT